VGWEGAGVFPVADVLVPVPVPVCLCLCVCACACACACASVCLGQRPWDFDGIDIHMKSVTLATHSRSRGRPGSPEAASNRGRPGGPKTGLPSPPPRPPGAPLHPPPFHPPPSPSLVPSPSAPHLRPPFRPPPSPPGRLSQARLSLILFSHPILIHKDRSLEDCPTARAATAAKFQAARAATARGGPSVAHHRRHPLHHEPLPQPDQQPQVDHQLPLCGLRARPGEPRL